MEFITQWKKTSSWNCYFDAFGWLEKKNLKKKSYIMAESPNTEHWCEFAHISFLQVGFGVSLKCHKAFSGCVTCFSNHRLYETLKQTVFKDA